MIVDLERLQKDVKDARKNVQQILKSMEHVVNVVMAMQGIQCALHEVSPPLENFLSVISDKRPENKEMQMNITLNGDSEQFERTQENQRRNNAFRDLESRVAEISDCLPSGRQ